MNKTHFAREGATNIGACGRRGRVSEEPRRVSCRSCQTRPDFLLAQANEIRERNLAFEAQTPREFAEPWRANGSDSIIVCKVDGGTLFRDAGRSCMGHYQDYKCASCGTVASRLTETGMSF